MSAAAKPATSERLCAAALELDAADEQLRALDARGVHAGEAYDQAVEAYRLSFRRLKARARSHRKGAAHG